MQMLLGCLFPWEPMWMPGNVDGRTAVHVASSEGRRDVVLWMKSVAEGKKKRTKGPSYLGTILASAVRASSRLLPKPKDKDKGKDKDGGKTADDTGGGTAEIEVPEEVRSGVFGVMREGYEGKFEGGFHGSKGEFVKILNRHSGMACC